MQPIHALVRGSTLLAALALALTMGGCYAHVHTGAHVSGHLVYYPPPAPRVAVTVQPVAPYAGAVWVEGNWVWNGSQYVWYDGHYVQARTGHTYVQARWVQSSNGWRYHPGYWSPVRGAVRVRAGPRARPHAYGHARGHGTVRTRSRGHVGEAVRDGRHDRRRGRPRGDRGDRRRRHHGGGGDADVRVGGSIGAEIR